MRKGNAEIVPFIKKCAVESWDNGIAYTDRFIERRMEKIFPEKNDS